MTADELAHQQLQQERVQTQQTAEIDSKMRQHLAALQAERLRRLQENEDFQWFMATYFAPLHQHNHDQALNIALTPDLRSNFAHRHDLSKTLLELPAKKEAELRTVAGLD